MNSNTRRLVLLASAAGLYAMTLLPAPALDSSDLLFHLTFDNGINAEFSPPGDGRDGGRQ